MTDSDTPQVDASANAATADETTPPTFDDIGLHGLILQAVKQTGYTVPTPIQAQALPVVMAGRDVMGAAQTGTGKTAAFTLPILHRLMPLANASASPARHPVRALILTPTRELADQVSESVKRYSLHTPLKSAVVFGGVDIGPQKVALRQGCEILIATPGRLLDHLSQNTVNLSQVGILVLDEADRMLDMGFLPDLDRIIRALPAQRQTLLFSATFSAEIRKLARTYQTTPVEIEVAKRNATADTVTQIAYPVAEEDKRAAVVHLVKSKGLNQVIVFSNTKMGTSRLARALERDGVKAESIHGDKSQADRIKALDAFKAGELEVLVATDVAARGLDVAGVPCVINYDLPIAPKTTFTVSGVPVAPVPVAMPSRSTPPPRKNCSSKSRSSSSGRFSVAVLICRPVPAPGRPTHEAIAPVPVRVNDRIAAAPSHAPIANRRARHRLTSFF